MGLHPQRTDTHQALRLEPIVRHPRLRPQRPRQVPVAFAADRRQNRRSLSGTERKKMAHLRASLAPLLPVAHAHTPAQPLIELRDRTVVLRDAEVTHPTTYVLRELVEPVRHRDAPASAREFPDTILEVLECRFRPTQFAPAKREPEEYACINRSNPTLLLVHRQLEPPIKIRGQTCLDALAGSFALDQDQ